MATNRLARMRRWRARECGHKIGYVTAERAERVADMLARREGWPIDHYPCRWCDRWHVEHRPEWAVERVEIEAGVGA